MKIDSVNGFVMDSPLELSSHEPVGIVVAKTGLGKTTLLTTVSLMLEDYNIIFYDAKNIDCSHVEGQNVVLKTCDLKDVFEFLQKISSFSHNSRVAVQTLVICDELKPVDFANIDKSDNLRYFVLSAASTGIRFLFATQDFDSKYESMLHRQVSLVNKDFVRYRITRIEGTRHFARM